MFINSEDVAGYVVDDEVFCPDCFRKLDHVANAEHLVSSNIVLRSELERREKIAFCDHCEASLT